MNDAIPWKRRSSPKAFVRFSNPKRSTRMTDVSPGRKRNFFMNFSRFKLKFIYGIYKLITDWLKRRNRLTDFAV